METDDYVAVTNIPSSYHTADLRAHFSSLIESGVFKCFHFRHRPEKSDVFDKGSQEVSKDNVIKVEARRCCVVKIDAKSTSYFIDRYNQQNWTDVNGDYSSDTCHLAYIHTKGNDTAVGHKTSQQRDPNNEDNTHDAVDEEKLQAMPELNPPEMMPNGNVGTPTLVFLDFIQRCLLPHSLIKKLQLKFPKSSAKRIYGHVNFEYEKNDPFYVENSQTNSSASTSTLLPSETFYNLSDSDKIMKSVQNRKKVERNKCSKECTDKDTDDSPKCCTTGIFGQVQDASCSWSCSSKVKIHASKLKNSKGSENICDSFKKSTVVETNSDNCEIPTQNREDEKCKERLQLEDEIISPETDGVKKCQQTFTIPPVKSREDSGVSRIERKRQQKEDKRRTRELMNEGIEERLIATDKKYRNDEDAEEWDRHEASEDDPSNQDRNKERLYEEEIEQPWEKGGPGVVFYTDAMFWQEREGDFDEQTADDLDVDFSAYEEPGAGDKDIRDFLKIRQENRFRSGFDSTDRFSIGIGKKLPQKVDISKQNNGELNLRIGTFEKHTKGIGRKVMEKQGWVEGQGLGSSRPGITQALKGEGQKTCNKRGLGYVEEKPPSYGAASALKKARQKIANHLITSAYDDPELVDPKEPLLQRPELSKLKHRPSHQEKFQGKS